MWKRQPTQTKSEETHRRVNKEDEGINGLLGQLLVSQALVDAELFNTLSFEQLDALKQVGTHMFEASKRKDIYVYSSNEANCKVV